MDDKWKDSGYDPQKAWDEVRRTQREEELRKLAEKHDKGSSGPLLWSLAGIGVLLVICVIGYFLSFAL